LAVVHFEVLTLSSESSRVSLFFAGEEAVDDPSRLPSARAWRVRM